MFVSSAIVFQSSCKINKILYNIFMSIEQTMINVGGSHESYRERELSNFSPHAFQFRGFEIENVEAFVQGLKYGEDDPFRYEVFKMRAPRAKRKSPKIPPEIIVWEGQAMRYRSLDHFRLQAAAIFAKFDQNEDAQDALLATGNLSLVHDLGHSEKPNTCLPADVFTKILEETRMQFFKEMGVSSTVLIGERPSIFIDDYIINYARS